MSKTTIYDMARKAKMRLRHNDYSEKKMGYMSGISSYIASHKADTKKQAPQQLPVKATEDTLYTKVCEILDNGGVANPVSLLIDREIFDGLDREGKQFYISSLTQKFKYLKDIYFRTHQDKFIV